MWPCNIPTVTTSCLLILRITFTTSPRWPSWEGGWPRRHPPWLLCSLSPVPETQPPPPAALPRTTSAQASGGAKSWTSPAPGSAPRPFRLSAWGCGELCWDRTTDNPGACVPTGIPPALCAPKLTLGERELRYAAISARLPAVSSAVKRATLGAFAILYPRPPASPPGLCNHSHHPQPLAFRPVWCLYKTPHRPAGKSWGHLERRFSARFSSARSCKAELRCFRAWESECRLRPDTMRHFLVETTKTRLKGAGGAEEGMRSAKNET